MEETKTLTTEQLEGLAKLRLPFDEKHISQLPKPTKKQTEELNLDFKVGIRCKVCNGWHHKNTVHLPYVGHAALTHRLLDVDPLWNWEPFKTEENGDPCLDKDGGMWIWLTVCGMTRRGYGDAGKKTGPDANKERIGDALRNAAMRFGAALDLWSKADLTNLEEPEEEEKPKSVSKFDSGKAWIDGHIAKGKKPEDLQAGWDAYFEPVIDSFTEQEQKDLRSDLKATLQELTEMQGDKQ